MASHLILKGTTYHVRLAVPADVQPFLNNRKVFAKSLGTSNKAKASLLSYPWLEKWKRMFEQVRRQQQLPEDAQEEVFNAVQTINETNTKRKRSLIGEAPVDLPDTDPALLAMLEQMGIVEILEEHYKEAGTGIDSSIEANEAIAEFFKGLIPQAYAAAFTEALPEEIEELASVVENPSSYKPRSPITPALLASWREHLDSQYDNAKTIDSHVSRLKRIAKYLTETGASLEFDTIHLFLLDISTSTNTRQQYLWSGKAFWEWATRYDSGFKSRFGSLQSPFVSHVLPRVIASRPKPWSAFERTDLERLHAEAKLRGLTELSEIIKFAAYTGCRLEEIGRVTTDDIIYRKQQPVAFQVTRAKSEAGERTIPIHPALIDLVLSRVEHPAEEKYLFVGGRNKYGNRLDGVSKQFGRLKKSLGFDESHVFHSIRKTTTTLLHRGGASVIVTPFILGHETNTITYDLYSNGPSMEQMTEAIMLIQFNFQ